VKLLTVEPGEGERRAQRGYVPQYQLAARVIYRALASGSLKWIGVADRGAGSFDDIVLGLHEKIVAYQVKSSRDPEAFSISTLLLGAEALLDKLATSRAKLLKSHPGVLVETVYVCDDFPRNNDRIADSGSPVSSSSFLRAHEAFRLAWSHDEWLASDFGAFIVALESACGLPTSDFAELWRQTQFITAGHGRNLGTDQLNDRDELRIQEIAALLPKLVTDKSDSDRWQIDDLLDRLRWRDPFKLRFSHLFPVDSLHEINTVTQQDLAKVLETESSGYLSLLGPPGCGKSTLLATGLLPTPRARVVRYLAFVPGEAQGIGRGEAFEFLHDLVKQLKQQQLGTKLIPGTELVELRQQFALLLTEAGQRYQTTRVRTVVVIDGLDHVPREERPSRSFLLELPLPGSIPDGILFILGSQRIDLADIPPSVRDQAANAPRCIVVAPLSREAVMRLADSAGVPPDVDRAALCDRADGHPLSARYLIDGVRNLATAEQRRAWLQSGPAYGGDVNIFYEKAWHDLEGNQDASRGISYLALIETPIQPATLDLSITGAATDAVWKAAAHLLYQNRDGAWSIFHNSFRLFLREKLPFRHGRRDADIIRQRYVELAGLAQFAADNDQHRWMELRYRARSGQSEAVAQLASAARFRRQFIEGRRPSEILTDIGMCFKAAKTLRSVELLFEMVLASHELAMRGEAITDEFFRALIAAGDLPAAEGLLYAENVTLTSGLGFLLVDEYLARGQFADARSLFEYLEPLGKLLGSEPLKEPYERDGLSEWSQQCLSFRSPEHFLACLDRLQIDDRFPNNLDIEYFKKELKISAACGQLKRDPMSDIGSLISSLRLAEGESVGLLYYAVFAADEVRDDLLVRKHMGEIQPCLAQLSYAARRDLSALALRLDQKQVAIDMFRDVPQPTLLASVSSSQESFRDSCEQVMLHSFLEVKLGFGTVFDTNVGADLRDALAKRLKGIGQLIGRGAANEHDDALSYLRGTIEFFQRATANPEDYAFNAQLFQALTAAIGRCVEAAHVTGDPTLDEFVAFVDALLTVEGNKLSSPSIRRRYATAVFRYEGDSGKAERRLNYRPDIEQTPAQQFSEAAETALTLVEVGLGEKSRKLLSDAHLISGLGYSRPPKKDPQHLLIEDLFLRANKQDKNGVPDRLAFLGRFLVGMSKTEGYSAASRLAPTFLKEAATESDAWAIAAADLAEREGFVSWDELVASLMLGLCNAEPTLSHIAVIVFCRLAIPLGSEIDTETLSGFVAASSAEHLHDVMEEMAGSLERDSCSQDRILALEALIDAGSGRNFRLADSVLSRWRSELPPPRSGNSPEDPFFLARSLEDILDLLRSDMDDSTRHGAAYAFARLAPKADYPVAKALFYKERVIHENERSLDAVTRLAISNRQLNDASDFIEKMRLRADMEGSWAGGFRSKAKQLYYKLRIAQGDFPARGQAFDEFLDDLASRKEHLDYLLPELGSIIELVVPNPNWAELWTILQRHLKVYREYGRGADVPVETNGVRPFERIICEVLFRAVSLTASALTVLARTAAIEIAGINGGSGITSMLVRRLWKAGGYMALEASQIMWECRRNPEVEAATGVILQEMASSPDLAIRSTAVELASTWGIEVSALRQELSPIYSMVLPRDPELLKFEPPTGFSEFSDGFRAKSPSTWTWPLEFPMTITREASGKEIVNLRWRTFQLMSEFDGASSFDSDAESRQLKRLRSLSLKIPYRKLLTAAAFQAMRYVIGELDAAAAIDRRAIDVILSNSGAFAPTISTVVAAVRPIGVARPTLPDGRSSVDKKMWVAGAHVDSVRPNVSGFSVLAATAVHERRTFSTNWVVQQYYGPHSEKVSMCLMTHLNSLPQVFVFEHGHPLYEDPALGGVARPQALPSSPFDREAIMLCPIFAESIGWRQAPFDSFQYLDSKGTVAAFTMHWRDGPLETGAKHSAERRFGYLLLVNSEYYEAIQTLLSPKYMSVAWRECQETSSGETVRGRAILEEDRP